MSLCDTIVDTIVEDGGLEEMVEDFALVIFRGFWIFSFALGENLELQLAGHSAGGRKSIVPECYRYPNLVDRSY